MATQPNTTDRRSFLSGTAIAAVAVTIPMAAAAAEPDGERRTAVQRWRQARIRLTSRAYVRTRPDHPDYKRLEKENNALSDKEAFALDAVMDTRTPNHAALIEKLKIVEAEFGDDFYIKSLIEDVRLLGGA